MGALDPYSYWYIIRFFKVRFFNGSSRSLIFMRELDFRVFILNLYIFFVVGSLIQFNHFILLFLYFMLRPSLLFDLSSYSLGFIFLY